VIRTLLILILLVHQVALADDRMGRLFLTPAERNSLDYIRQTSKPPDKQIKPDVAEPVEGEAATTTTPPAAVTVEGYVKRSDGKGTVWVNRQPLRETSTRGDLAVGRVGETDGRVQLKFSGAAKEVRLKAGQTYDPASGAVVERARDLSGAAKPDAAPTDDQAAKPVGPAPLAPKKP
jgi:hypothetical protein